MDTEDPQVLKYPLSVAAGISQFQGHEEWPSLREHVSLHCICGLLNTSSNLDIFYTLVKLFSGEEAPRRSFFLL